MKYALVLLLAGICSLPALSAAGAHGPVGGNETPGDPSLLVTYPNPSAPTSVAEPAKPEPPAEQGVEPQTIQKEG